MNRCIGALVFLSHAATAQSFADLVLLNGKVWTGDDRQSVVEAVACIGPRIVATGTSADIRKWAGPETQVLELEGRLVLPGFNDAHVHVLDAGQHVASVQLRDARSESEFRDRIAGYAAKLPAGRWIIGGDWDHEAWSPARLPSRALIDDATDGHPLFINRLDGHMVLVNTQVLRMAGIHRETPDPPGGAIVRDERGEPTGVLKDSAMELARRLMPRLGEDEMADAVRAAMRVAKENGVTSLQDVATTPGLLRVYQKLLRRGELTFRISGHYPLGDWRRLADAGITAGFGNPYLRIGALKGFSDGSLGSTTALSSNLSPMRHIPAAFRART